MRILRETTDIGFSDDMDFKFDSNTNDFFIANELNAEVSTQTIIKRIVSTPGEWKLQRECGAALGNFKGFTIDSDLISLIKSYIYDELTRNLTFDSRDLQVRVIPLSKSRVSIVVILKTEYMQKPVVVSTGLSLDSFTPIFDKENRIG